MASNLASSQEKELFENCKNVLTSMRWLVQVAEKQPEPVPLQKMQFLYDLAEHVVTDLQSAHEQIEKNRADARQAAANPQEARDIFNREKAEFESQRAEFEQEKDSTRQSLNREKAELEAQLAAMRDAKDAQERAARHQDEAKILRAQVEKQDLAIQSLERKRVEAVTHLVQLQEQLKVADRARLEALQQAQGHIQDLRDEASRHKILQDKLKECELEHQRMRLAAENAEKVTGALRQELGLAKQALEDKTLQIQQQQSHVSNRLDYVVQAMESLKVLDNTEVHAQALLEGLNYINNRRGDADREIRASQDLQRQFDEAGVELARLQTTVAYQSASIAAAKTRVAEDQLAAMALERDDANEQLKRLKNMEKNLARSNDRVEALQAEVDNFRQLSSLRLPVLPTDEWPAVVHKVVNHLLRLRVETPDGSTGLRNIICHLTRVSAFPDTHTRMETFFSTVDKQDGWYCLNRIALYEWAVPPGPLQGSKCQDCLDEEQEYCPQIRQINADAGARHLHCRYWAIEPPQ